MLDLIKNRDIYEIKKEFNARVQSLVEQQLDFMKTTISPLDEVSEKVHKIKEKIFNSFDKNEFKDKYGKDAENVMYATSWKLAKKQALKEMFTDLKSGKLRNTKSVKKIEGFKGPFLNESNEIVYLNFIDGTWYNHSKRRYE